MSCHSRFLSGCNDLVTHWAVGAKMSDYLVYLLNTDGHIAEAKDLVCDTDEEACQRARRFNHDFAPVEVWHGARRIEVIFRLGAWSGCQCKESGTLELNSIEDFSLTEDRWAEMRRTTRVQTSLPGRLGYGGSEPGVASCQILDLSDTGVRVEVYVPLDPMPEAFSIEFGDVYCRARRCWARGNEIGLEFIFDTAK
jgi:hypothetical protein